MTLIAFAGEDENHFRVATALVDGALVMHAQLGSRVPRRVDQRVLPVFGHRG